MRTVIGMLGAAAMLWSQGLQTTVVRAGKLFDPKSGQMLASQVVLIQGERITAVGPAASVPIPAGAKVIDLSRATVLPGLIDGHVHLTDATGGLQVRFRHGRKDGRARSSDVVANRAAAEAAVFASSRRSSSVSAYASPLQ